MSKTLQEIADLLDAKLIGEPQCVVTAVLPLNTAEKGTLSFISDHKYLAEVESCQASALIVNERLAQELSGNLIVVDDPYLGYAKVAQMFDSSPKPQPGISSQAVICKSAKIGENVYIGPKAVIESDVVIGDGTIIEAGVFIGSNSQVGNNTRIYPNSVIYHSVSIGSDCIIHANAVIGSDGFGYANEKGQWVKIPQVGSVIIADKVEIGAHTAIDRGALENTEIGEGVILDNHIHIAHNVRIGKHTAIAGCTAIAGSTSIGNYCTIAGRVSIIGHLTICDKVHLTACTLVNKSIKKPGAYSSATTFQTNKDWQRSAVRFKQLDEMWRKLKLVEKELAELKSRDKSNDH